MQYAELAYINHIHHHDLCGSIEALMVQKLLVGIASTTKIRKIPKGYNIFNGEALMLSD